MNLVTLLDREPKVKSEWGCHWTYYLTLIVGNALFTQHLAHYCELCNVKALPAISPHKVHYIFRNWSSYMWQVDRILSQSVSNGGNK